jgi:hypothetical protein
MAKEKVQITPQFEVAPDREEIAQANTTINDDVAQYIASHEAGVSRVVGRATMMDPSFRAKGIDYTAGGKLEVRWVLKQETNMSRATARGWVLPENVSPRLRNQEHDGLLLMVRLREQGDNYRKFYEQEAQRFESNAFSVKDNEKKGFSEVSMVKAQTRRGSEV